MKRKNNVKNGLNNKTNTINKKVEQDFVNVESEIQDNEADGEITQEICEIETDNDCVGNSSLAPVDRGWAWVILAGKVIVLNSSKVFTIISTFSLF